MGAYRSLVSFIGVVMPFLAFGAAAAIFVTMTSFEQADPSFITGPLFHWAVTKGLVIDIGLKMDQLSIVMALMVTGVGSLIHLYSVGYMGHDEGYARYFAQLNLFLFFMLTLVLADNLILMFVGWEGVGLCSYLLIGFWFEDIAKARAGTKAFIVNRIGDAFFLAGLFLIYAVMASARAPVEAGYFNFEMMSRYNAYFVPTAAIVSLLLFGGAIGKSAQIPLYVWLPDAMAGPTPVSALIHAATMVTAGVYMVVRLNFIFALSPFALSVVASVGAATALYAATMGLTQTDIKKILAYSTISQLGYMFLAAGVGAFSAAIGHLITHAFFKALLFLCAGSVIHAMGGEQDIRNMGGLRYRMPVTCWTFVVAAMAIAGIAPAAGFFSKDAILWQTFERGQYLLWTVGFVAAGMTAFYIFRAVGMVFFGESNVPPEKYKKVHESPTSMAMPLIILAFLSLLGGLITVPHVLGGEDRLGTWLSRLIAYEIGHSPGEKSNAQEIVVMVITLLWSIHFMVLGWVIYAQKREWPNAVAQKFGFVYRLVANKYYVDEIYDFLIVRPLNWISTKILWQTIDDTFVDGLAVHGTARTVGVWANIVSMAETGVLQQYLLYFLIGAVVVVGYLAL
jgi:NADH-quinone oxidoreductase subunit L